MEIKAEQCCTVCVDFGKYQDILMALEALANEQFRTVEGQILACVHQSLSTGRDHK